MKNFLDKPITWGGYLKLSGISFIVGMIGMIPYLKWLGFDWKDCLPESWFKK